MRSSTSIPAYLWRNTFRRWLENPASPATKFLVPFLFGLLALLIFGLLRGVEAELQKQLSRSDLRSITTHETIMSDEAENRFLTALEYPAPWASLCESSELLLQAPLSASSRFFPRMPVIGYVEEPGFVKLPEAKPGEPRSAVILSARSFPENILARADHIEVARSYRIPATMMPMPSELKAVFQTQAIALVPAEMMGPALARTHTRIQMLTPKSSVSTAQLETFIRNFADAEGRDLRIFSAQGILEQLEQITERQKLARVLLGTGIAIILSLILGSLSLLEFRQELYLFALLRSFGVRSSYLLFHYFLETALVAFSGGLAALWITKSIIPRMISQQQGATKLSVPFSMETVETSDISILFIALVIGIFLSALPLIPGLRRPAGLMLP